MFACDAFLSSFVCCSVIGLLVCFFCFAFVVFAVCFCVEIRLFGFVFVTTIVFVLLLFCVCVCFVLSYCFNLRVASLLVLSSSCVRH